MTGWQRKKHPRGHTLQRRLISRTRRVPMYVWAMGREWKV